MALSEHIRITPSDILSVMGYACHIAEIWLSQGNRLFPNGQQIPVYVTGKADFTPAVG